MTMIEQLDKGGGIGRYRRGNAQTEQIIHNIKQNTTHQLLDKSTTLYPIMYVFTLYNLFVHLRYIHMVEYIHTIACTLRVRQICSKSCCCVKGL